MRTLHKVILSTALTLALFSPSPAEPDATVNAALGSERLAQLLHKKVDAKDEKLQRIKNSDGTVEIVRRYRPSHDKPFGLITHTYYASSVQDAKRMYKVLHGGTYNVGSLLVNFEAKTGILGLGEDHEVYSLVSKTKPPVGADGQPGKPVVLGTYAQVRKERVVITFLIQGIYFGEKKDLEAVMSPWLTEAEEALPSKAGK